MLGSTVTQESIEQDYIKKEELNHKITTMHGIMNIENMIRRQKLTQNYEAYHFKFVANGCRRLKITLRKITLRQNFLKLKIKISFWFYILRMISIMEKPKWGSQGYKMV